MENKVLKQNLDAVGRYDLNLADKIFNAKYEKSNITLAKTENNEYNLYLGNIPLHNESGVLLESRRIAEKIKDKDNKNIIRIVYGLGLGYLADEIANVINSNIIIYEPVIDILKFVFETARIDAIFKNNVYIAVNKDELINLIRKLGSCNTEISISFLNSYKILFEKDIKDVLNTAARTIGEICAEKNIENRKLPALYNTFLNLKKMTKNPDISQLEGIYKGASALIVSAGETLSENIEIIKENQDKAVIFAVNQSVNTLVENNIKSDFVVNIDVIDNKNHFKNLKAGDCYGILEGYCFPDVFNLPFKKTFNYISEGNFFNSWLRDCLSVKHHLISTGTVSISAFLAALYMGFEKIILIGQDLAYKNGKCYTKGALGDELQCVLENNKYVIKPKNEESFFHSMKKENETMEECTAGMQDYIKLLNKNLCTVEGQDGKLLPSLISYSYFIDYFTKLAKIIKKERPNTLLINSSVGGALIEGFDNIDLKEAFKDAPVIKKLNLENIEPDYDKDRLIKKSKQLYKELNNLPSSLSALEKHEYGDIIKFIIKSSDNKNKEENNAQSVLDFCKSRLSGLIDYLS